MIVKLRELLLDAIFEQEIVAMTLEMRAGRGVTVTGHLLQGSAHIIDANIHTACADTHTQTHSYVHTHTDTQTHTLGQRTLVSTCPSLHIRFPDSGSCHELVHSLLLLRSHHG